MNIGTDVKGTFFSVVTTVSLTWICACSAPATSSNSSVEEQGQSVTTQIENQVIVPVAETERFIERDLLNKVGVMTKVTCPSKMEGQVGDFFVCLVENLSNPNDSSYADVQIMNDLGEISYLVR